MIKDYDMRRIYIYIYIIFLEKNRFIKPTIEHLFSLVPKKR